MKETKNLGGRPREYDRDDIAEKMVAWSQKEDSTNLLGFCVLYQLDPTKITIWASECDKFRKAYNTAKANVGFRREQKLSSGELHQKAYHLNAHVYDQFMKAENREEKLFDHETQKKLLQFMHELKSDAQETLSDDLKERFDSLMSQITISQKAKR